MKVASKRTGLSPHLIRMWERRYRAITPERSPSGRRLFSDRDIARLDLLKRATEDGETIGQIAGLSDQELAQMVAAVPTSAPGELAGKTATSTDNFLKAALDSVSELNEADLESTLLRAAAALGQPVFIDKLLAPLLEELGQRWNSGEIRVAQEHLASAVIRSVLGDMVLTHRADDRSPLLIATTPAGQQHEFGALIVAVTATACGWRSMYLGPNLPAEEIASSAGEAGADVIALSLVYPEDDPRLNLELSRLRRLTGPHTKILVGGRAIGAYETVLDEIKAIQVHDIGQLRELLTRLRNGSSRSWQ
jgi:DNA-binding transcriptional MerR regulator/methylmalonyl-CoA mutase cobalamin-binding subunit